MQIEREFTKLEHSAARMTVTLGKDYVQSEYDKAVKELLKDIQLAGFRKGYVPREVLERKAGPSLKEDILNQLIGDTTKSIFDETDFPEEFRPLPLIDPKVEGEPVLELGKGLVFSVVYDIHPEFTVEKWEGFTVEVDEAELQDEDINRELEKLRQRNAIVIDREEGEPVRKGDVASITICELNDNNQPVEKTRRDNFVFELGGKEDAYQISDDITGMKMLEERTFTKTYAENAGIAEFAGRTLQLNVKMLSIKKKELPDLDDDLAQDISEKFKTLDDLKQNIRETLQNKVTAKIKAAQKNALLSKILENITIDVPESYILSEIQQRFRRLSEFGLAIPEANMANDFFKQMREDAEHRVKRMLLTQKLIKQCSIVLADEDLDAEYERYAKNTGESVESIKAYLDKYPENRQEFTIQALEYKLFDMLTSKNTIKRGKKTAFLDLFPEYA